MVIWLGPRARAPDCLPEVSMTLELGLPKTFVRFAAVALIAAATDERDVRASRIGWTRPTGWVAAIKLQTQTPIRCNRATPDLASIPDKPVAPSTVDERTQVADTLKADRADAQYSGDALRGGTEPSAAPPSGMRRRSKHQLVRQRLRAPAESSSEQQQPASAAAPSSAPTCRDCGFCAGMRQRARSICSGDAGRARPGCEHRACARRCEHTRCNAAER